MRPNAEIPSLTALRGIAALAVVVYHLDKHSIGFGELVAAFPPLHRFYLAVDFFFVLSGFVIEHVYGATLAAGQRRRAFLAARLARIWPLNLLTLAALAGIVATLPHLPRFISFPWAAMPMDAVMLEAWYPRPTWNYPAWSIGQEALVYLGIAFLAPRLRGARAYGAALLGIAVLGAICALRGGHVDATSTIFGLSRAAAGFMVGLALRRAWPAHASWLHRAAAWSLAPLILLAWASAFDLAWIAAIVAVMLLAIPARGIIHTALNTGPLRFLGDISYSIYLWHAPVHLAIEGVLLRAGVDLPHLSAASRLAIGAAMLLATILIATLGYRGFEVPARRWLRARLAT